MRAYTLKGTVRKAFEDTYSTMQQYVVHLVITGIALHLFYAAIYRDGYVPIYWELRVISTVTLVPLLFKRAIENSRFRWILPLYTIVTLFFVTVFFATYVLLDTLQRTPSDVNMITTMQVQLGFSIACFIAFIPRIVVTITGVFSCMGFAFIAVATFGSGVTSESAVRFGYLISPFWIFYVFMALYYMKNREVYQNEKHRAMTAIGANLAHEIRTPLSAIHSRVGAISGFLPILVDQYSKSVSESEREISDRKAKLLACACEDISNELTMTNTLVDIFLMNLRNEVGVERDEKYLASDVVSEAISRFPFASRTEAGFVKVDVQEDFELEYSKILLVHVFLNLLKNAVHFAQDSKTPSVRLVVGSQRSVSVIDNGPGISRRDQRRIFDRFYTTRPNIGSGVGLSFCRTVMDAVGGTIEVHSAPSRGASFKLSFP